ncbi:sulfite exporter TauE/SafE family protein [Gleimia sp. 6138-11-ORH1]|uniref:sulfite exporter TauE/SafE family protein n=1 Tax=Gleimia sp. 6138-11-ORH1 TaxID=2973937 RepID=UPI002167008A|nr:sulfite exporter TauE/SafE family protein [Gleimia sp. 6138-11-ORH1]MCS4484798.1 sulfite exporter TauE/SafE family protein [Gleimia sp. 6138-11-ORH1]
MESIIIAIIVGLAVGTVVGALGAGGGILAIPALIYLLGQSPHGAAMGSLAIVLATALTALPSRIRAGNVRYKEGLIFAAIVMSGSVFGARVAGWVSATFLLTSFAVMVSLMSVVMLRKGLIEARRAKRGNLSERSGERKALGVVILAALVTGFLTGFLGLGGGFIIVPILITVLGFNIREAAGTSLLIMILAAFSGLVSRWGQPIEVDWLIVFAFMAGSMAGSFVGAPLSQRAKPYVLTLIFSALLAGVGAATAVALVF